MFEKTKQFFKKSSPDKITEEQELMESIKLGALPKHIAIIMDGNGRWAQKRAMPRTFGHRAGAETLHNIVNLCSSLQISYLTVYAFSTENWKRPQDEVSFLMNLFIEFLQKEITELHNNNVRMNFIGDTSALGVNVREVMDEAINKTAANTGLTLNVAVNYGGRSEIIRAVNMIIEDIQQHDKIENNMIDERIFSQYLYTSGQPDPDLLIRPSGDLRISNFLLWQLAYTEFWLTDDLWPDIKPLHILKAIDDFQSRERRFGGIKGKK